MAITSNPAQLPAAGCGNQQTWASEFAGYPGDESGPQRNLINYWVHGKGAAKIQWGSEGGFRRCVVMVGPKLPPGIDVKGMCANLHKAAAGKWPGEHRGGE